MGEEVDKKKKSNGKTKQKKEYLPSLEKFTFYHFYGEEK